MPQSRFSFFILVIYRLQRQTVSYYVKLCIPEKDRPEGMNNMDYRMRLQRNVPKNYLFVLLQNTDLTRGVWMIYLAAKGLSLLQIGLLETVFHLTSLAMEVPTGVIADVFGRKLSRVLGRLSALAGYALLFWADTFFGLALSFLFAALSYNLESGAGEALVYDSLQEVGAAEQYVSIAGKNEVCYQAAGTVSFLVGGYLAGRSYAAAFGATLAAAAAALGQATAFTEPAGGRSRRAGSGGAKMLAQLRESVAVIRSNRPAAGQIVFLQTMLAFCTCIFFYLQNFLKGDGYGEAAIGAIYAVASLTAATAAARAAALERRFTERGVLKVMPLVALASAWGIALSRYPFIFFTTLLSAESVIYVATNNYINQRIPSSCRATVLSFSSMTFSVVMILLFPLLGWAGDLFTLRTAIRGLGLLGAAAILINCRQQAVVSRGANGPQSQRQA